MVHVCVSVPFDPSLGDRFLWQLMEKPDLYKLPCYAMAFTQHRHLIFIMCPWWGNGNLWQTRLPVAVHLSLSWLKHATWFSNALTQQNICPLSQPCTNACAYVWLSCEVLLWRCWQDVQTQKVRVCCFHSGEVCRACSLTFILAGSTDLGASHSRNKVKQSSQLSVTTDNKKQRILKPPPHPVNICDNL